MCKFNGTTMPRRDAQKVKDERCLLKISECYAYQKFLYYLIGNYLELTHHKLTSIITNNQTSSVGSVCGFVFYNMLVCGYVRHGAEVFNKLYLAFEAADLEYDYKSFLSNNDMSYCLPSIN